MQFLIIFFTPSIDASENLIREGRDGKNIFMVGNVMIDSLLRCVDKIKNVKNKFKIPSEFALITLHRPVNVDNISNLKLIMDQLLTLSKDTHLVFPVHPRTKKILKEVNEQYNNISFLEPLDYFSFIHLEMNAKYVLTDSGGVQEETTFLKVPCFTLRTTTERPITVEIGSNKLIKEYDDIYSVINESLKVDKFKDYEIPPLWDGFTGERIAKIIYNIVK